MSQKDTIDVSLGDQGIWLTPHMVQPESFPKRRNRDWGLLGFMFVLRALYLGGSAGSGWNSAPEGTLAHSEECPPKHRVS